MEFLKLVMSSSSKCPDAPLALPRPFPLEFELPRMLASEVSAHLEKPFKTRKSTAMLAMMQQCKICVRKCVGHSLAHTRTQKS